jgi:hypothetical protein
MSGNMTARQEAELEASNQADIDMDWDAWIAESVRLRRSAGSES